MSSLSIYLLSGSVVVKPKALFIKIILKYRKLVGTDLFANILINIKTEFWCANEFAAANDLGI
jgi:hypothetical protein